MRALLGNANYSCLPPEVREAAAVALIKQERQRGKGVFIKCCKVGSRPDVETRRSSREVLANEVG